MDANLDYKVSPLGVSILIYNGFACLHVCLCYFCFVVDPLRRASAPTMCDLLHEQSGQQGVRQNRRRKYYHLTSSLNI